MVDVVVPVHNEEVALGPNVTRLRAYLDHSFPFSCVLTVVDNASSDRTAEIAVDLARRLPGVRAMSLAEKGRGRAVRAAWTASRADVVAYMDIDLSTDLDALLPLVAPLVSGHSDISVGTRLARGSQVVRGPKRELISRCYNLLVRGALGTGFSDAQCGFKAMRQEVAQVLLPEVHDDEWFFDTELLVLAERSGLRIHEVPVDWVDDPDSRVDIGRTALADLLGIARLVRSSWRGDGRSDLTLPGGRLQHQREWQRMAGVGLLSTVSFLVLFVVLRAWLGVWIADVLALTICSVANLLAHVGLSIGHGGPSIRSRVGGTAVVLLVNLVLTLLALVVVQAVVGHHLVAQLVAVVLGTIAAASLRLVALRGWWRPRPHWGSAGGLVEHGPHGHSSPERTPTTRPRPS